MRGVLRVLSPTCDPSHGLVTAAPISVHNPPSAVVLDVLAERGFTVVLDVIRADVPSHLSRPQPDAPLAIVCRQEKSWVCK